VPDGGTVTVEVSATLDRRYRRSSGRHAGAYVLWRIGGRDRHAESPLGVRSVLHHQARRQGTDLGLSMVYGRPQSNGIFMSTAPSGGRRHHLPRAGRWLNWQPTWVARDQQ
jgi:hypothetical protein